MLKIKILTPEKIIKETEIESLTLNTTTGVITILVGHSPLISTIFKGEMFLKYKNELEHFAIFNGVLKVETLENNQTFISVLLESVEDVSLLDKQIQDKAIKRAKELLQEKLEDDDLFITEALLEKELNKSRILLKRRKV